MEEDEDGGRREMIRDITIGQYYPQSSVIHRLDPRVKLLGTVCHICFFDSQCSGFYHCDGSDGSFDCAVKSTGELYAERVKIHFYDYSLNLLFQPFSDAGRQFIQDWFFECNCTGIKDRSLYGHASELSDYWLISDDIVHYTVPADSWS